MKTHGRRVPLSRIISPDELLGELEELDQLTLLALEILLAAFAA